MYCNSIGQSYHPKNAITKLVNTTPELYAIVRLDLNLDRMLNNRDTPFLLQVRALAQNFIFKIGGEVVARHLSEAGNDGLGTVKLDRVRWTQHNLIASCRKPCHVRGALYRVTKTLAAYS